MIYLYDRTAEGCREDRRFNDKDQLIKSSRGSYIEPKYERDSCEIAHYCEHCHNIVAGRWQWEFCDWTIFSQCWTEWTREKWSGRSYYMLPSHCEEWTKITVNNEKDYMHSFNDPDKIREYLDPDPKDLECYCYYSQNVDGICRFGFDAQLKKAIEKYICVPPAERLIQYHSEIESFFTMTSCPLCGKEFKKDEAYHGVAGWEGIAYDLQEAFPDYSVEDCGYDCEGWIEDIENRIESDAAKNAEKKAAAAFERFEMKPADRLEKKAFAPDELKVYLGYIYRLEENIFFLTERLKALYYGHTQSERKVIAARGLQLMSTKEELKQKQDAYIAAEKADPAKMVALSDFAFAAPRKPVEPEKPLPPVLKKPNLFNKQKAIAYNEEQNAAYQEKLADYAAKAEAYTEAMAGYDRTVAELTKKQQEQYAAKLAVLKQEKQDKLAKMESEIIAGEKRIAEIETDSPDWVTAEKVEKALIEKEISEAETTLGETCKALNELYSYGVVFSKYRNIVAVSAFYEYLTCGRCTALEGADGAYNIYESEIRADRMIAQLSQVIKSLDAIRENQYALYNSIQETNKRLAKMEHSMKSAVSSLREIEFSTRNMRDTMDEIANYTAIAAYNSSVTAFYAQKNAELTDALGYMIAMK